MYHACACRSGAGRSINVIAIVFSDEINRVPNVIAKNRFSCRYNALIARDRGRFVRLISATAYYTLWTAYGMHKL